IALGLAVTTTTPAVGSIVSSVPVDYVVNFTDPINISTVDATDFTVDGLPADSVMINGPTQVTFHYNSAPFGTQGQHAMAMAAGAILRDPDGSPLAAFLGTFRYDAVLLQVTSTAPPAGGTFTLPGPFTFDVNFNEPVDPGSVQTSDLALSGLAGAFVSDVTVLPGNTTARFTIGGISAEGTLSAGIAAGAITDAFGNPGSGFSASHRVAVGPFPHPTPPPAQNPPGSLFFAPITPAGLITSPGDSDTFPLPAGPAQTLPVLVPATDAGLRPTVTLLDPTNLV